MKKSLICVFASIVGVLSLADWTPAAAAPAPKVTICHRTHSVKNPYVRITVSQNSVGNGNGKHGGASHDQWSNVLFASKPSPNVFNPAVTYSPAPEKKWGDIISFTDVNGDPLVGGAANVAGLNNFGIGAQIFLGVGDYTGLCRSMSARDYYEVEVNEGGQAGAAVLEEMQEIESEEWESARLACPGGTFVGCDPNVLGVPTSPGSIPKVTICHRTHSVTNPYVRITVAQSAVGAGNGKHGGASHDDWSSAYGSKPSPNVFNPATTYPSNSKKWGDIISFTDVDGGALQGAAAARAGLNNFGIGAQIFLGVGAYTGLCKSMSARDYYEVEVNEGGQTAADVLQEMEESDPSEWAAAKTACSGTFVGCAPATLGPLSSPPAPPSPVLPTPVSSPGKVTICHRTHSVTNPYVRITVSQNSVGNGNGKHGGASHDQWSNVLFASKPSPNVFNPAVTYSPAPEKKWGDIISFTDVNGNALQGGAAAVAGLNNFGIGASIFNGTGSFAGLCGAKSARAFYDIEVNEGGQDPEDVLEDMDDADSDEWSDAKRSCGGRFKGCSPDKLGPSSDSSSTRRLRGTMWIDSNRDGVKSPSERVLASYPVVVTPGSGNTSSKSYTAITNENGEYEIRDIPAGNWIVRPAALPSTNYQQVYDSDSGLARVDWTVRATVPPTGEAVADFAAALTPTAVSNRVADTLGTDPIVQKLRGSIWVDSDRDGVKDVGEKVLANYPLVITPGPGNTSGRSFNVSTDGAGNYRVPNIPAGNWVVKPAALPSPNYEPVFDSDSGLNRPDWSAEVAVPTGGEGVADFAAAPKNATSGGSDDLGTAPIPQRLRGSMWIDANRDGLKGLSERVLSNYPITVTPGPGNTSGKSYSVTTDANGNYEVLDLPSGIWIVRPAALPSVNYQQVFDTDSGVGRADWSVRAVVPVGGEGVADFAAALTPSALAAGARDSLGSPPANPETPRLGGSIWVDANRDGVQGPQEKVLANYPLLVTPGPGNTSGKSFSVTTDASGRYRLSDIPPGSWIVKPAPLPNPDYEQVFDTDSGIQGADWTVAVTVPATGVGEANFATALSRMALESGAVDVLGSAPAQPRLPVTGNDVVRLLWIALLLVTCGWTLMRRRRLPGA